MPDSGWASTGPATNKTLLLALTPGPTMQASSRFLAPMTTMNPLLRTMRTVLPRPSFPDQLPSLLSLRAMTTRIAAALVPLSTQGNVIVAGDMPRALDSRVLGPVRLHEIWRWWRPVIQMGASSNGD